MKFKLKLTENLGVKLIAVVVAIFIWFNASGQQEVTRIRNIPAVVAGLADSLTLTSPVPAQVEISVRGTKRQLLTMGVKRVQLVINLSGAQPGRQRMGSAAAPARVQCPAPSRASFAGVRRGRAHF